MVPLSDDNLARKTPYITYVIIGINIWVFWHQINLPESDINQFFQLFAVVPKSLSESFQGINTNPTFPEQWTLITSQFLHGGFLHLAGNMLYLWIFGNNVEDRLGHFRYLLFYLACGALAALSQWYFSPQSPIPIVGASGAIAGVMGAYIIRFPHAQILTLIPLGFFITTIRLPAIFFLGFWFAQQAFFSFASLNLLGDSAAVQSGGVAYWAHAGGFVFGIILGPLLGLFYNRDR